MNFKTEHKIKKELLEKFRKNIGKSIAFISAEGAFRDSDGQIVLDNIQLDFIGSFGDNSLMFRNLYQYYEVHGDELNNIGISILEFDASPLGLVYRKPTNFQMNVPERLEIKEIQIFGQHRVRKWDWGFASSQNFIEGLDPHGDHSDEIFTLEVVRLINANDDRSIYFRSIRNGLEVLISESPLNYLDATYRKEELDLNYNWLDDQDDSTDEKVYKLHYVIN